MRPLAGRGRAFCVLLQVDCALGHSAEGPRRRSRSSVLAVVACSSTPTRPPVTAAHAGFDHPPREPGATWQTPSRRARAAARPSRGQAAGPVQLLDVPLVDWKSWRRARISTYPTRATFRYGDEHYAALSVVYDHPGPSDPDSCLDEFWAKTRRSPTVMACGLGEAQLSHDAGDRWRCGRSCSGPRAASTRCS